MSYRVVYTHKLFGHAVVGTYPWRWLACFACWVTDWFTPGDRSLRSYRIEEIHK